MNHLRFNILIVDDERSNLEILVKILKKGEVVTGYDERTYDYILSVAKSGHAAIRIAAENQPDLILLDIIMPGMDGFETLAALKASDLTRHIPVIFITGLDSVDSEEKGLSLGAVDYITKPFHSSLVRARVRTYLKIVEQMHTIEQLGYIDTLTGVPNRRGFDNRFATEWGRAVRQNTSISLLMIDIDRFKLFNDTHGHQQGDEALKSVASVITRALKRPADYAARWGGEEFAAILPETDYSGALALAENIRRDVENTTIANLTGGDSLSVTVSIGVNTETPNVHSLIPDFTMKADKALYAAKSAGRNRVC